MNSRVVSERICGPLSLIGQQQRDLPAGGGLGDPVAVAAGDRGAQRRGGPLVGGLEQALGVQGGEERGLDLGGGLLRAGERGQPLAGDHVQDRDRGAPGPGPVGEVVGPDPVGLPFQPVWPGRAGDRLARRRALQDQAFGGQHPAHRGLAGVHQPDPRAAVGELAVRAVDLAPGLEQLDDRGTLPAQQSVQRVPARRSVLQRPASRRAAQW